MTALVDTGFMLAYLAQNDKYHQPCREALSNELNPLIPEAILPELAYMVIRDLGYATFIIFMRTMLNNRQQIIWTTEADLTRATDIMEQYADSKIDFVDCVIMAIAERLNITRILTIDQRHFRLFRPQHAEAFEILP